MSLRRGLELLVVLASAAEHGETPSAARLAQLVGGDAGQVSGLLATLAEFGLVRRDPATLGYSLGWRLHMLADMAGEQQLLEQAGPVLRQLVAALDETAHLTVLQEGQVLTLMSETSVNQTVRVAGSVGRIAPAHCTASGRALLMDHTPEQLAELFGDLPYDRMAPNSPASLAELERRIGAAAAVGSVIVDEEFEPGLIAVAAPVRDASGRIVAALNVSGPRFRFADHIREAQRLVEAAAAGLSSRLEREGVHGPA